MRLPSLVDVLGALLEGPQRPRHLLQRHASCPYPGADRPCRRSRLLGLLSGGGGRPVGWLISGLGLTHRNTGSVPIFGTVCGEPNIIVSCVLKILFAYIRDTLGGSQESVHIRVLVLRSTSSVSVLS